MRSALTFAVAALLGAGATQVLRPAADPPAYARGAPVEGSRSIEGRVPDPYGLPPGAARGTDPRTVPDPPPWAVAVWRDRRGRVCHEAGPLVDNETPGRGGQIPGVPATEQTFLEPLVGSLRPDSRSGTGIQFYNLGRFLGYPFAEGSSCGEPDAGLGLLVSLEHRFERRDLGPDRTVVSGVAGRRVRTVLVESRPLALSPRRAFIALFDGITHPRVEVRYSDGCTRRLAFTP